MSSPYSAWRDVNDSCKPSPCGDHLAFMHSPFSPAMIFTLRKVGISLSSSYSCGSCSFVFDSLNLSLFQSYLLFRVWVFHCFIVLAQKQTSNKQTPALTLKERKIAFFLESFGVTIAWKQI